MKYMLTIYCGILLGFIITGFLYSCRFSLLHETETNLSPRMVNSLFQPRVDEGAILATKTNNCFETAIKCPAVGPCDCVTMCGNQFQMVSVQSDSEIVYLNQKLEPGKYCLPNQMIPCPKQYAFSLFDASGKSSCVCKFPSIYGGPFCNEKQACLNGVLTNLLTDMPVDDLDIRNGNYYCKCFPDKHGNQMIHLPGDPLNCVSDPCLKLMVTAPPGIGMTPEGLCHCGTVTNHRIKNLYPDDPTSPCSPCFVQWTSESEVRIPLRCLSTKGVVTGSAPPCKDVTINQCERLSPVKIEVSS